MPLLYYWRGDNYRRDLDMGAGYHLNQANPLLHNIDIGDSLWAFTRRLDGTYVLAAELVIAAKTLNRPKFRYGAYRIWGNINHSRYFQVEGQPSIELVVRNLSCATNAEVLGRSFQGYRAVKAITQEDHKILVEAARNLPIESRARILPEERLEASLLLNDPDAVEALIKNERPGIAEHRARYLYQQAPLRNRSLVHQLRELYNGICQLCEWNPRPRYKADLCQAHHIQWLSRGGDDALENMMLVCPNHHAAIHQCDAPLDYFDFAFIFPNHRKPVMLNYHLPNQSHNRKI